MTTLIRLKSMKDEQIQTWLHKVSRENVVDLEQALLGADEGVIDCITRNMSAQAKTHLLGDLRQMRSAGIKDEVIRRKAAELERLF